MDTQFAQTDVVVVGGGLAGLSVACYLARANVAVTLFEKASDLGGRAVTQVYDEYCFNRGGHALYKGGAAQRVLQELGITYSGHSPKGYFMLHQGKLHVLPSNPLALFSTAMLDVADILEFTRLLTMLMMLKAHELRRVSIQEWLERNTQREQVRQVMAALARTFTYTAALDRVSAEVFVTQTQHSLKHNVLYIDGGWQSLIDGLRKAAEQTGVRIVSGTRVTAVDHKDGRVQGVRLRDGRAVRASAVIIATNAHDATKLVDEGTYSVLRQIVAAIVPVQVACLDVALRQLPSSKHPVVFDLERPRFQSVQSLFTKIAPQGGALIHTFKYLDSAYSTDPREDERDLEDLLDTLQPGWRDVLVKRIYLPRIDAVSMLPTATGEGFAGRPGPQVPGIAGLYLAGDWIGSEGYLTDASMASARQVAQLLLQGGLASIAFLVMLENLGPLERAVFLLREVFDYDYAEIAAIVGKSEANCRQILHRAHQHLGQHHPRFDVSREQQERITYQFLRASINGDMQGLLSLLADDIVFTGDGGGKAQAGLRPVHGADKVARGMLGGLSKWLPPGVQPRVEEVNGQPAIVGYLDDRPYGVVILDIAGERVRGVYIVLNPDKLHWLDTLPH